MAQTFDEWFAWQEALVKSPVAKTKLEHVWRTLTGNGVSTAMAASCLDDVITVMREEYWGDGRAQG